MPGGKSGLEGGIELLDWLSGYQAALQLQCAHSSVFYFIQIHGFPNRQQKFFFTSRSELAKLNFFRINTTINLVKPCFPRQ